MHCQLMDAASADVQRPKNINHKLLICAEISPIAI